MRIKVRNEKRETKGTKKERKPEINTKLMQYFRYINQIADSHKGQNQSNKELKKSKLKSTEKIIKKRH